MSRILCVCLFLLLSGPVTAQEHPALRWGTPNTGHILVHDTFVLSYDGRLRSARWTAERLTNESLVVGAGVDRQNGYREDPRIPVEFRAHLDDYSGSGRDRGHLANSANHRLTQAMNDDTFYLSNMCPRSVRTSTGTIGLGWKRPFVTSPSGQALLGYICSRVHFLCRMTHRISVRLRLTMARTSSPSRIASSAPTTCRSRPTTSRPCSPSVTTGLVPQTRRDTRCGPSSCPTRRLRPTHRLRTLA